MSHWRRQIHRRARHRNELKRENEICRRVEAVLAGNEYCFEVALLEDVGRLTGVHNMQETTYPGYARARIPSGKDHWEVKDGSVANLRREFFPSCTSTSGVVRRIDGCAIFALGLEIFRDVFIVPVMVYPGSAPVFEPGCLRLEPASLDALRTPVLAVLPMGRSRPGSKS